MPSRFEKFSERARKVLSLAQEEAQRFNHNYIGTEHILLGLVRETEGVAARVLFNLSVELSKVRSAVEFIIGKGDRPSPGDIGLTPRAKKVIELAVDEARKLDHHYIGTEHILLALLEEEDGVATRVLENLGVDLSKVRSEILGQIGETVEIGLVRDEKQLKIKTTLIEHIEYANEPMVGFLASTPNQKFTFPFDIDINTGNVGGPSAGMMMALNVYNLLTESDITNGEKIAGTGTIEIDGSVGPVGGVKQKVIAAKRANASLILVPTANYLEASVYSDENTSIVAVDSFEEALEVISDFSSR